LLHPARKRDRLANYFNYNFKILDLLFFLLFSISQKRNTGRARRTDKRFCEVKCRARIHEDWPAGCSRFYAWPAFGTIGE